MLKDTEERKKDKSDNTLEAGRQKHTLPLADFGVQENCNVTDHSSVKMGSQLCCRTQKRVRFPPVWLPEYSLLGLCSQAGYQNILTRLRENEDTIYNHCPARSISSDHHGK